MTIDQSYLDDSLGKVCCNQNFEMDPIIAWFNSLCDPWNVQRSSQVNVIEGNDR